MNKSSSIITAKNTTATASSLKWHKLEVARVDQNSLRLQVPNSKAAVTRLNQWLKENGLPYVVDHTPTTIHLRRRGDPARRDIAKVNFPEWDSPGATADFVLPRTAVLAKAAA
jgi:hypothetical protein